MKKTVVELKAMLAGLPNDLVIDFMPISDAWLGTMNPMRIDDISFFSKDGMKFVMPDEPGATGRIYLKEDR